MNNKWQYVLFLISGGTSALANLLSRIFLSHFTSYAIAVAIAYVFGIIVAYTLMRVFVFHKDGINTRDSFQKFVLVNLYGFTQTILTSLGFLSLLEFYRVPAYAPEIAHGCALGLSAITSFVMHKSFTFK